MHHLFTDEGCERFLLDELHRALPSGTHRAMLGGVRTDAPLTTPWTFCRQAFPNAVDVEAPSINAFADHVLNAAMQHLPRGQPWRLEVQPDYGEGAAGQNRSRLIVESLRERLAKKQRSLLRSLVASEAPWSAEESFIQLRLLSPEQGILSVSVAPEPLAALCNVWPFPKGEVPVAVDKSAPSRAFAKVIEAEHRLGVKISVGETCVDLGASPGSWSYVVMQRGARVTSIDRSELREDLMRSPRVRFVQGDAFKYVPEAPVDWMLCDVIAAPDRNIAVLLDWLRAGRMKKFIVSIKFLGHEQYSLLDPLKPILMEACSTLVLTRLCANKNEVCAAGVLR